MQCVNEAWKSNKGGNLTLFLHHLTHCRNFYVYLHFLLSVFTNQNLMRAKQKDNKALPHCTSHWPCAAITNLSKQAFAFNLMCFFCVLVFFPSITYSSLPDGRTIHNPVLKTRFKLNLSITIKIFCGFLKQFHISKENIIWVTGHFAG